MSLSGNYIGRWKKCLYRVHLWSGLIKVHLIVWLHCLNKVNCSLCCHHRFLHFQHAWKVSRAGRRHACYRPQTCRGTVFQCSSASTTETQWQCYSRGHGPLAPMAQGRVTPGQVRHITRSGLGRGPATRGLLPRGGPAAIDYRKWPQGPRPQERPQAPVCRGLPRGQGGQLIHCQEPSPGHSPAAIFA